MTRERSKMTVLGIDPGFSYTGHACITLNTNGHIQVSSCGTLSLPKKESLCKRVGIFNAFFEKQILQHKVTSLALETSFLGKNPQTFLKLGYLRGVSYLLADKYNLSIKEYAPREIKLALTGRGESSKEQVAYMVHKLLVRNTLLSSSLGPDATDALAIAFCGLHTLVREKRKETLKSI